MKKLLILSIIFLIQSSLVNANNNINSLFYRYVINDTKYIELNIRCSSKVCNISIQYDLTQHKEITLTSKDIDYIYLNLLNKKYINIPPKKHFNQEFNRNKVHIVKLTLRDSYMEFSLPFEFYGYEFANKETKLIDAIGKFIDKYIDKKTNIE